MAAALELIETDRVAPQDAKGPRVWAIGGGKGGVGKSVLTCNLAVAFARRGHHCVVVDADLGGANLHTLLGVSRPHQTLSHFVRREVQNLGDVVCETPVPNLQLVSGARALLGLANFKHTQKERLLRHIRALEADHVFVDLSAGSAYNVLDFFLAADEGVVVVVPEPTSIENAYHFLKAAFFRSLARAARHSSVRAAVEQVIKDREREPVLSPRELVERVRELDEVAGAALESRTRAFRPRLVVNQVRTPEHRRVGVDVSVACHEYLGTEVVYLGAVGRDEAVHCAVSRRQPVLDLAPACSFAREVEALAARMLTEREPADREELERTYRHRRALYDPSSLATHGLLSEAERRLRLERLEASYVERARLSAPEPPPPPVRNLPPSDFSQPGDYLRRCREHLELSLEEVFDRTRLPNLGHIEAERFELLPPEPYLRGHVLQYARYLGVREAETLAESFMQQFRAAFS